MKKNMSKTKQKIILNTQFPSNQTFGAHIRTQIDYGKLFKTLQKNFFVDHLNNTKKFKKNKKTSVFFLFFFKSRM